MTNINVNEVVRRSPSGPPVFVITPNDPVSVLNYLRPGGTIVEAINEAFADPDATEVYFPPGYDYDIDGPITSDLEGKVIRFIAGAVLTMSPNGLGSLVVNGQSSSIVGFPVVRFNATSTVAYVAVDLHGVASECDQIRFEVNANIANCTLMRLSGRFAKVGDTVFAGSGGSFRYGLELSNQDGTQVSFARFGSMLWQMTDDGINTRSFSALVRYRATRSQGGSISIDIGGRHFFNSIVEVDGQHNSLFDPQINSSSASNYGVLQKDDAEFFAIYGGELVGNYLAGSIGIACGDGSKLVGPPAVGQLKLFDTKIRNWDFGIRITGTADTPTFIGATIANNKTAQIKIDSQRGADIWPVSGLAIIGCYSEEVAFPGIPFLHLVSGALQGGVISGCEIGYTGTAVLVEAAMSTNNMEFLGCRFPSANGVTDAVTTPNTNSNFFFGRNAQNGLELISKGAFAARATSIDNIVCTTLKVNTSIQIGSAGDPFFQENFTFVTANFAAGIPANDFVELTFSFAAATTTRMLTWSLIGGTAAGNSSLLFYAYTSASGTVTLRARNITGVAVGAVSSTLFLRATKTF